MKDGLTNSWTIYLPQLYGLTSCGYTECEALEHFKEAVEVFFTADFQNVPHGVKIGERVL